jgi:hypothetical protein
MGARFSAPVQTGSGYRVLSSAEVKERVDLYIYTPSGPSWPVTGWTLLYFNPLLNYKYNLCSLTLCHLMTYIYIYIYIYVWGGYYQEEECSLSSLPEDDSTPVETCSNVQCVTPRPVFRYFTPPGPKKILRPPPSICSYSVMCKQKQHKKLTKNKTL